MISEAEANQINDPLAAQGLSRTGQLRTFTIQDTGGTRKTIENGIAQIKELLPEAGRSSVNPVGKPSHPGPRVRRIGRLQRGVRQPALGAATCWSARGPRAGAEIYGAEHLLTRRAVNRKWVAVERIHWWEDYTSSWA